jgi:hypothetical protein
LDPAKIERDVKALWQSQRPSDVRVEEVTSDETVKLLFRVTPRHPLILRKVEVNPSMPGLKAGVEPGGQIDAQNAQWIAAEVRRQLEHSGYPAASVDATLSPLGNGKADLLIHIDKKQAVDVGAATFSGHLGLDPSELRGALHATRSKTMIPHIPGLWNGWHVLPGYNSDSIPSDLASLRSLYYSRGYFDAGITANPVEINAGKARVEFVVESGPQYAVQGQPLKTLCRELLEERADAEHEGVLDFSVRVEVREAPIEAGDERPRVDLAVTTQKGAPYRVGRIEFRGNHRFSDTMLRRSLLLDEGQLVDETRLRQSMARINAMGFFEPLTERSVVVNTPPGSDRAGITFWLTEKKLRHWNLSGPVGPMSLAGPLEFALGSRLPAWGRDALELSTYTLSARLMLFAKPLGSLIPFLPNKRFIPLVTVSRPLLPGQRFFSGATFVPQLGWKGMLAGYGASQTRDLLGGVFQSTPPAPRLSITIAKDDREGALFCEPSRPTLDRVRQFAGIAVNQAFLFLPF